MTARDQRTVPQAQRRIEDVQGHWLLARLGKRVLRPGGGALTTAMLTDARIGGADVVEMAPGLGRTAAEILADGPRSYRAIDQDRDAVTRVQAVVGTRGVVSQAEAADTGLESGSADVVVGEAMLTMQSERGKAGIVSEAVRLLRPGGRYAIHELGLAPDDIDDAIATDIRKSLARSIKVNARPLTIAEWRGLLEDAGLKVTQVRTAPMDLLKLRRNIEDEGWSGVARIAFNLLRWPGARRRVMDMSSTFRRYADYLIGVSLVAELPGNGPDGLPGSSPDHKENKENPNE
ncbi:Methyltransferase domain-containing protein [Propionibacterium cyclohexanicum]|uniref:Methyltransferase domain-containing protein n=1 Tax=Propionibacterium cyclohexanicum TaxID=64702 RepID=A0A1H9RII5_9ACTN|nr:class I SAM-dependent methyltransferase [Propionibacterium cyclohexanicum]SER72641.1 Methyltransferase domain-containing protein [Propionibacterium cyclohexanicum]